MSDDQQLLTVVLDKQPVELYKILKFEGIEPSGAQAKRAIDEGTVSVNGEVETRRRRKIVSGDVIVVHNVQLDIVYQGVAAS